MRISIGTKNDRRQIDYIIKQNIANGYNVFFDGQEYYIDVLTDGSVYRAPDIIELDKQQDNLNKG